MMYAATHLDTAVYESLDYEYVVTEWLDTTEWVSIRFYPNNTYYAEDYHSPLPEPWGDYGVYYRYGDTIFMRPSIDIRNSDNYLDKKFAVYLQQDTLITLLGYSEGYGREIVKNDGPNLRLFSLKKSGKLVRKYFAVMQGMYDFAEKNGAYRSLGKIGVDTLTIFRSLGDYEGFPNSMKILTCKSWKLKKSKEEYGFNYDSIVFYKDNKASLFNSEEKIDAPFIIETIIVGENLDLYWEVTLYFPSNPVYKGLEYIKFYIWESGLNDEGIAFRLRRSEDHYKDRTIKYH